MSLNAPFRTRSRCEDDRLRLEFNNSLLRAAILPKLTSAYKGRDFQPVSAATTRDEMTNFDCNMHILFWTTRADEQILRIHRAPVSWPAVLSRSHVP